LKDLHVKLLALALVFFASTLVFYKVHTLGLPILPSDDVEVWSVEARVAFRPNEGPVKVRFALPSSPEGFVVADENYVSGKYGLAFELADDNRIAEWAVRRARGEQVLYYQLHLARDDNQISEIQPTITNLQSEVVYFPKVPGYSEATATIVDALLDEVRQKSADIKTFTRELLLRFNAEEPDENVQVLLRNLKTDEARVTLLRSVLAGARIPTRVAHILLLHDGSRHGKLEAWLQVHDGERWLSFNPNNGLSKLPNNALIWKTGQTPLLDVVGGVQTSIDFSVSRHTQEPILLAEQRARKLDSRAMEFSLYSLPVQTQNVYRILLMVPLGAFLIVLLRNIIGIKTFGTFMPILIALAFRETELIWGIVLFSLIVALGLAIRFYLEYLKLLLVPRLAAVLIIVIILMTVMTVISYKLGFSHGLSVALFPMVILAMTIERMSLIWEEKGPSEALMQGVGSLFVASIGFLVMSDGILNHLIFVFPELLLIILAFTLLLGRYTGYRLTELWRFRETWRQ
jgi:hypothetical protein